MASILTPTIEYHCVIGTDDTDGVLSKKDGVLSVTNGSYAHEVLMEPLNDVARLGKLEGTPVNAKSHEAEDLTLTLRQAYLFFRSPSDLDQWP